MTNSHDYSVRVKNGSGWRQFDRARLMISVGQSYHEGAKLKATVDWLNHNPGIREVHISVNDSLQRHNYLAAGMTEPRATAAALLAGTLWLERNDDILAGINAKTYASRWEEWLKRPDFAAAHTAVLGYARTNPLFEEAIESDAHRLAERKVKRGEPVFDLERMIAGSRDYVTEELAVFALQSRELPAAEVYPGSNLASAHYLLGKPLPAEIAPLSTRYFTRIDFARINVSDEALPPYPQVTEAKRFSFG
jgi:tRNA-dependent cyclodipeptide synthase